MDRGFPEARPDRPQYSPRPIGAGLDPHSGEQFHGAVTLSAGAAEFGVVQLYNPPTSNRRLIVEEITVSRGATGVSQLSLSIVPGTTFAARWRGGGAGNYPGAGEIRTSVPAAAATTTIWQGRILGSTVVRLDQRRIVLEPGEGIEVGDQTANTTTIVSFAGREEPL